MSLNTAHIDGGVLIHQGEVILLHAPNVTVAFTGNDDLKKYAEKTGNAYLTSHRLIFIAKKNQNNFHSFSFPFVTLSQVDVEQPVFGSNFLKGKVRAQPDGGFIGESKFKLSFKSGGAIEFATGMMKAIQLAKQMTGASQYWSAPPPAYAEVVGGAMPAPPMYYSTPQNYYGWAPPAYNFPSPDAGTIYMSEAPPPYPGIGGFGQQQQQQYPQLPAYAPQQPGFAPQQQPYQQPQSGFAPPPYSAYPQNPGYPPQQQQPYANGGYYPPAAGASAQNGVAYSNFNNTNGGPGQVYVPAYDPPPTMNQGSKKND